MLSGNGRHRRPRQAPALVVAAGVTGSALALPLFGATGASAADATTWDRLAECESGGAWSADQGNGYYGGFQFSQEMWEEYGGLDYAPSADMASRSQQISVAEKVLRDQGPAAWPSCAPVAGLTKGGATADVNPGDPVTPAPSDPADPSGPSGPSDEDSGSGTPSDEPSETSSDEAAPEPSDSPADGARKDDRDAQDERGEKDEKSEKNEKRGKGDGSKEGKEETEKRPGGKHRKDDAPDKSADSRDKNHEKPGKSGQEPPTSPDGDASGDGSAGRHRGEPADEQPSDGTSRDDGRGRHPSRGSDRGGAEEAYTVRSGDSLSAIADAHDVDGGWPALYAGNKKEVGADPDLIIPGQRLDLGEK